jgi:hypothetical protein
MSRLAHAGIIAIALAVVWVRAAAPIRVMLLDGESAGTYHKWRQTSPVLKKELDETSLFAVDVVTAPPAGDSFSAFAPAFSRYQVVVLNYDAPDERWPVSLKTSFEEFVKNGGGLVVVHAADNAFPGWPAFNEMIGVGGWRNRTESAGPFWYVKDERLVSDDTPPRRQSRHPECFAFACANRSTRSRASSTWDASGRRVTRGLRPGKHMTVPRRSFRIRPIADAVTSRKMVVNYGRGRVFHTTPATTSTR